jgi:hypothetical protein
MVPSRNEILHYSSSLHFVFSDLGRQSVCRLQRASGLGTDWVGISCATSREAAVGYDIGSHNGIIGIKNDELPFISQLSGVVVSNELL